MNLLKIVFLSFFLVTTGHAEVIPLQKGCEEWKKQQAELIEPATKDAPNTLKAGKSADDLIAYLQIFPMPDSLSIQGFYPKEGESQREVWKRIYLLPVGCNMPFYDASRVLLAIPNLTKKQKKSAFDIFRQRLHQDFDQRGSIISLLLLDKIFETMLTQKWVILSDAAYFEFSHLLRDCKEEQNHEQERNFAGDFPCSSTDCSEKEARQSLHLIREDQLRVNAIYAQQERWASRVWPETTTVPK